MNKLISIKTSENKGNPVCDNCPMLLQCEFNMVADFSNGRFWVPGPECPVYNSKADEVIREAITKLEQEDGSVEVIEMLRSLYAV